MTTEEAKALFFKIGEGLEGARRSKMFGADCMKAPNGKAWAMFYQGDMVFKLKDEPYNEAMALDGADLFNPMGTRPMGGWVQLPADYADQWPYFAQEALDYVKSIKK